LIVRALALERHGLQIVRPDADVCAPALNGRALTLWSDRARAAAEIRSWSAKDADQYPRFLDSFARIGGVLRAVLAMTPPSIDNPTSGDLLDVLRAGRQFRALGKTDAYRLIRWLPMAVADLAGECSRASRCARRWPPAGCSDRFSDRGPPAAPPSCCCSARRPDSRWRTAGR
jgi:phytoene dehydrogenase-like protein